MRIKVIAFSLLIVGITCIKAQNPEVITTLSSPETLVKDTSYWKLSGITGVNFSQTALVNWVAGGENAIAINAYLNGSLKYEKERWLWQNDLNLEYGTVRSEQYNWRKSSDKIAFASKLGYQINKHWYYSVLFDFNTQFTKGYNYPNDVDWISNFMAPAYSDLAFGLDYKPNDNFSFFMSPLSVRFTFVLDDTLSRRGSFGLDPGDKVKVEAGALFKASMKKTVMENVDVISNLSAFTPYNRDFGNIDINWDLMASFKINQVLTATLNTTLRYFNAEHYINYKNDPKGVDEGPKVQFKEIFGLGLAYRF